MRYKVFLDTNILISGIFFSGNESKILDLAEIDFLTSEDNIEELTRITKRKLKYLGERTLEIALLELEKAISDIRVIRRKRYTSRIKKAEKLISHKKDAPILAAVLAGKPDYFKTGDAHFFTDDIKNIVNVLDSKTFLNEIKKAR